MYVHENQSPGRNPVPEDLRSYFTHQGNVVTGKKVKDWDSKYNVTIQEDCHHMHLPIIVHIRGPNWKGQGSMKRGFLVQVKSNSIHARLLPHPVLHSTTHDNFPT